MIYAHPNNGSILDYEIPGPVYIYDYEKVDSDYDVRKCAEKYGFKILARSDYKDDMNAILEKYPDLRNLLRYF